SITAAGTCRIATWPRSPARLRAKDSSETICGNATSADPGRNISLQYAVYGSPARCGCELAAVRPGSYDLRLGSRHTSRCVVSAVLRAAPAAPAEKTNGLRVDQSIFVEGPKRVSQEGRGTLRPRLCRRT